MFTYTLSICMKLLFSIFFFCIMTLPCFAQDSTKVRSLDTFAVKPLLGLGLINGARVGVQVQYGDIAALEVGGGIDFLPVATIFFRGYSGFQYLTLSQALILTPFPEKRLSLILYHAYLSDRDIPNIQRHWQFMIGWSIPLGEFTHSRFSLGGSISDEREYGLYGLSASDGITFDFIMTFNHAKIRL